MSLSMVARSVKTEVYGQNYSEELFVEETGV